MEVGGREVGGRALNSHGNYIVDHGNHGKIMESCFCISVGTLRREFIGFSSLIRP